MNSSEPMPITGHKLDHWVMHRMCVPAVGFLGRVSGRSNFFWARVFCSLGLALVGAAAISQSFTLKSLSLMSVLGALPGLIVAVMAVLVYKIFNGRINKLEEICGTQTDAISGATIASSNYFIQTRWRFLLFAGLELAVYTQSYSIWVTTLVVSGFVLTAFAGFCATCFQPPGQSLWARVKNAVRSPLQQRELAPVPI